ncbi:MAG TPA: ribosome-associated translation inhibitor RaiA, partial [Microlunatus sp.]
MDVVVKARHCSVSDQFRSYVDEKIIRLEKLDDRAIRVEVEISEERNKRQHDQASRVEITLHSKGPVVRAEAAAEDKPAAFDLALDKLMAQL